MAEFDRYQLTMILNQPHPRWLAGRDLSRADLRYAPLQGADLRGANLEGADLRWANLNGADLHGAIYNSSTHWPDGFNPARSGAQIAVEVQGIRRPPR